MADRGTVAGHRDKAILFGLGSTAGVLGGLAIAHRRSAPRRLPRLEVWQRALAETRGEVKAALLAAKVRARYDELYAGRPRFAQRALRMHLETSILPGLALYQILRDEEGSEEAALARLDPLFAAWVQQASRPKLFRLMGRLPDPFPILRVGNRLAMRAFPPEGWTFEWLEDSSRCVAYNIYECFYLNVLTAYGAPELTAQFCRQDDLLWGNLPGFSWERTKTLDRGDDCCDFRFCRTARPRGESEKDS